MRFDRGMAGWGLFLIVAGSVPLAVRAGALDAGLVARAWELWPLLLIGAGLGLVLSRTRAEPLGGLLVAVTLGLMAGGFIAGWMDGPNGRPGGAAICGDGTGGAAFPAATGPLEGDARVQLTMDCGALAVHQAGGTAWTVDGTSGDGRGPIVDAAAGRLVVAPPDRSGMGIPAAVDYRVGLPSSARLDLGVTLNAGTATVDLAQLQAPAVRVTVNAGAGTLTLVDASMTGTLDATVNAGSLAVALPRTGLSGSVTVNAGSARLCVPANAAIRLRVTQNALATTNFDAFGLVRQGDTWSTPGYDLQSTVIDLAVKASLGSVSLAQEGDCD